MAVADTDDFHPLLLLLWRREDTLGVVDEVEDPGIVVECVVTCLVLQG